MNTPGCDEQAITFDCEGETLVGVLHRPPLASTDTLPRTAFVVIVGGPQYRAGSHRHFVTFARDMAAAGHAVLRFDVRGMGDSSGELRSFERIDADVGAAIDALCATRPETRGVALWGLCDGASAALMYLQQRRDPRVTALCLLNPWVRSEAGQARTQVKHYYLDRLRQRSFWVKLFSGRVAATAISGLIRNLRLAAGDGERSAPGSGSYQDRMLEGWRRFAGPSLVVLSGNDYTAKEFVDYTAARQPWHDLLNGPRVRRHRIDEADHTFSGAHVKQQVLELTLAWVRSDVIAFAPTGTA